MVCREGDTNIFNEILRSIYSIIFFAAGGEAEKKGLACIDSSKTLSQVVIFIVDGEDSSSF